MRRHTQIGVAPRAARTRGGFTLMELLVVMGIIILMTAMALPAISKFLDGQSLQQSGRILQSAFNDARRAAITQRTKQYLVFFREADVGTGEQRYGLRRYRDRFGYEGDSHFLLPGTQLDLFDEATGMPALPAVTAPTACVGRARGLFVPVFEPAPSETDSQLFSATRSPITNGTILWIEFKKDGTVELVGGNYERAPAGAAATLFDLNTPFEVGQSAFDDLKKLTDLNLRENSESQNVDKRCFVDLDPNTGRVSIRVVQPLSQT